MSLFESTMLSFCNSQSKLDFPTLRQGSRERKNATNKKIWHSLGFEPRSLAYRADALPTVSWQNLNINSYKLSNLQPIPPLSFLHVDFDRHVFVNSIFFLWMSSVDSIISIVIFHIFYVVIWINNVEFFQTLSKLDLPTLRHGSRERKNTTEQMKKYDTR